MTGKTHQIIGISAGLSYYLVTAPQAYNPATFGAVLVLTSLGSLLPDIDQPSSKLWKSIPLGEIWSEAINPLLEHRNLTHSLLGFGLVIWGVHWLLQQAPDYWGIHTGTAMIAFAIAYGSHIVADMLTVAGVPLLFPYQRMFGIPPKPFEGMRIETGQWFENLLIFPAVNIFFLYLLWSHLPEIKMLLFQ